MVTADLTKAIEEATHTNVDQFFDQWVYGAGAPKYDVSYSYDDAKKQVLLTVKQTQKIEGRVGLFRVPVEVEITNQHRSEVVSDYRFESHRNIYLSFLDCTANGSLRQGKSSLEVRGVQERKEGTVFPIEKCK